MRSKPKKVTFTQAARRAQIVTAAIEVIAEVGWAQTSIRKIADRVGVAMSAVLYHFGTKDNLVDAIIEEMYRSALSAVAPALQAEDTSAGKLTAYIRANIAYFDGHRVQLAALAQLGTGYQPSDGRRFDELGMTDELREELAVLDPTAILVADNGIASLESFPRGRCRLRCGAPSMRSWKRSCANRTSMPAPTPRTWSPSSIVR